MEMLLTLCRRHILQRLQRYIAKRLWEDIANKIYQNQFGNRRNLSKCHYLVGLLHALYSSAEKPRSISTIFLTDRINHNVLVTNLL